MRRALLRRRCLEAARDFFLLTPLLLSAWKNEERFTRGEPHRRANCVASNRAGWRVIETFDAWRTTSCEYSAYPLA